MLLLGSTAYAATLAVPVLLGAVIPVLAWRIGADLAGERGLPPERARTLALGSGLVSAVALPLVLPSALLDSTVPFGVAALAACLLGTRLLREPRGARVRDPRLLGLGLALGLAALARNEAIWVALAWARRLATSRRPAPSRAVRARLVLVPAVVALAVMAPWLVRQAITFGTPLPGPGDHERVVDHRLRDLRLEGARRRWPATWPRARRLAGRSRRRLPAQPRERARAARDADRGRRPGRAALGRPEPVAPAAGGLRRGHRSRSRRWSSRSRRPGAPTSTRRCRPQVLLVVSGLAALDAGLAWVGRRRAWTRPVAWLGPLFAGVGALLFLGLGIPSYGGQRRGDRGALRGARRRASRPWAIRWTRPSP